MSLVGATVRYRTPGLQHIAESKVVKTMRTMDGKFALKLANGQILFEPPRVLIKVN